MYIYTHVQAMRNCYAFILNAYFLTHIGGGLRLYPHTCASNANPKRIGNRQCKLHMYVHIYTYLIVQLYTCTYAGTYMNVYCVHLALNVYCVHVCLYDKNMLFYIYIHIYIYIYMYMHVSLFFCIPICRFPVA